MWRAAFFSEYFRLIALVAVTSLALPGCGASASTYQSPDHWSKAGYSWPGESPEVEEAAVLPEADAGLAQLQTRAAPPPSSATSVSLPRVERIAAPEPGRAFGLQGSACFSELSRRKVHFKVLESLKGVTDPVQIEGPLGGVDFWANDGRSLQLDCRLAVALDRLAPVFKQHQVTRIRYSGAYSYRSTRSGRLSHHAYGLAIDLHDFEFQSAKVSVQGAFQKNVGCSPNASPLNQLTCAMRSQALFEEFLTPDFNHDHRDHLHISVPRKK